MLNAPICIDSPTHRVTGPLGFLAFQVSGRRRDEGEVLFNLIIRKVGPEVT